MKCGWWSLVLVLGFSGCFGDSNNSGPPDLTPKDVVGCWQNRSDSCYLRCFDRSGRYMGEQGLGSFDAREDSGGYGIQGFSVAVSRELASAQGVFGSTTDVWYFEAQNHQLVPLNQSGSIAGVNWIHASPDSFPCGTKPWRFFQKPAGWDSLVKPLQ